MPSEMVECVARGLYKRNPYYESGEALDGFQVTPGGCYSWDECCEHQPGYAQALREDARAAIEAMHLLTPQMLFAMERVRRNLEFLEGPDVDIASVPLRLACWEAAIDAALSEEEGGDG